MGQHEQNILISELNKSIYYDPRHVMSYNCLFNFIVGERGNGKSFGFKELLVKKALESLDALLSEDNEFKFYGDYPHISQFFYLRRKGVEAEAGGIKFFEDLIRENKFPGRHLHFKQTKHFGVFYCRVDDVDHVIGYAFSLNTLGNYKSIGFPYIDRGMFDEFIVDPDKGQRYLKHETETFKDFYETIGRPGTKNAVYIYFVANRVSDINPYFIWYNITTPTNQKGIRVFYGDLLVQLTKNDEFREKKMQSRYYQMLQKAGDTKYIDYAVNNKALRDTDDFIRKAPSDGQYRFTIRFLDKDVAVYFSYNENMYFISDKVDNNFGVRFTTEPTLHTEGCTYVKRKGTSALFTNFLIYLENSLVWYRNKEVKYVTLRGLSNFR